MTQLTDFKPVGFIEANRRGFARMFAFKGRVSRSEYWWFICTGAFVAGLLFAMLYVVLINVWFEANLGLDRYIELFVADGAELPDNIYFRTYFYGGIFLGVFPLFAIYVRRLLKRLGELIIPYNWAEPKTSTLTLRR